MLKKIMLCLVFTPMLLNGCGLRLSTPDRDMRNTSNASEKAVDTLIENKPLSSDAGVVKIRSDHFNSHFTLYNLDKTVWKSFVFGDEFDDESLHPFALKAENNLLVFTFRGEENGFYKVIVDEQKGTLKYIKKDDPNFVFETWEHHLIEVFSVDFDYKNNPIRKTPGDSAAILPLEMGEDTFYHPVNTEKNWLQIKTENGSGGWIKWRDNNGKLLISIYYDA